MREAIIDRIDEQRHKLASKYFSGISIVGLLVSVVALAMSPDLLGDISALSLIIMAAILILIIIAYRYRAQKYGGQFIEWTEDSIIFKTRQRSSHSVQIEQIKEIDIQFDTVEFLMSDGSKTTLNFIDFHDVEDRKRIKTNFEKMKIMPNTS